MEFQALGFVLAPYWLLATILGVTQQMEDLSNYPVTKGQGWDRNITPKEAPAPQCLQRTGIWSSIQVSHLGGQVVEPSSICCLLECVTVEAKLEAQQLQVTPGTFIWDVGV